MDSVQKDKKTDILFVGGMYEKEREAEYLQNSPNGIQNAVNSQQWSLIDGFRSINGVTLRAITAPFLATYPYYKKIIINYSQNNGVINTGYINLPILRNISRYLRLRRNIKKWSNITNANKILVCYYMSIPHMLAAISITKSEAVRTLVIPDLPDFLSFSKDMQFLRKLNYRIKRYIIKYIIYKFDRYIVMTKHMAEKLRLPENTWIVSEGMVHEEDILSSKAIRSRKFLNNDVVYTGGMHVDYDVDNLLDATKLITDKSINFYFYGSGDLSDKIKFIAENDKKVHYMGFCDRNEVLNRQKNAKVLINPRGNNHDYVKYSFPSKNLEYLASGTPVLGCKLDCIPDEYDEWFYYMADNTPKQIAKSISDIIKTPDEELINKSVGAADFIRANKLNLVECRRILKLLMSMKSGTEDQGIV